MKKAIEEVHPKVKRLISKAKKPPPRGEEPSLDRLTFTGHFTFDHFGEAPIAQDFRMQSVLDKTYQPVVRRMVISAKDAPLDTQWIPNDETGLIILENRVGSGLLTTPTPEEWGEMKKQIVRVAFKGAKKGFLLRPGRIMIIEPEDVSELILKALDEPVPVNLYIFSL